MSFDLKYPYAGAERMLPQKKGKLTIRVCCIVFLYHQSLSIGQDMRLTSQVQCLYEMFKVYGRSRWAKTSLSSSFLLHSAFLGILLIQEEIFIFNEQKWK